MLGETITTDDIVDPSTSPDALSQTIVASTVEQYTATKARKRTTTASGPTSLSQKSKDGKLLGDITSTESVVAPSSDPDAVSSTILSSEVKQVDSGKAIKRNVVLNSTPALSGGQTGEGLLGTKTTTESIVAAGTAPDGVSLTVLESQVEPIDSVRSRKATVESSGPTSLQATSLVDSAVGQVPAIVSQSIVSPSTTPAGGKFILQDQISAIDEAKARRETVTVADYPNLTTYDLDEPLGVVIINERTVVNHNEPYSAPPLILSSTDRPIDQWKTLRITSRLANLPETRIEYKTQQFTFPAILDAVVVTSLNLGFGNVQIDEDTTEFETEINKYVSVTPIIRPAVSTPTNIRVVTTFYASPPLPDTLFGILPQSVSFSGSLLSFNFGDVILNNLTIGPITASPYDNRYAGLSESISFAASSPTKSEYDALIGTEVVTFSDVEYYRSNLWVKKTGYITLR